MRKRPTTYAKRKLTCRTHQHTHQLQKPADMSTPVSKWLAPTVTMDDRTKFGSLRSDLLHIPTILRGHRQARRTNRRCFQLKYLKAGAALVHKVQRERGPDEADFCLIGGATLHAAEVMRDTLSQRSYLQHLPMNQWEDTQKACAHRLSGHLNLRKADAYAVACSSCMPPTYRWPASRQSRVWLEAFRVVRLLQRPQCALHWVVVGDHILHATPRCLPWAQGRRLVAGLGAALPARGHREQPPHPQRHAHAHT